MGDVKDSTPVGGVTGMPIAVLSQALKDTTKVPR